LIHHFIEVHTDENYLSFLVSRFCFDVGSGLELEGEAKQDFIPCSSVELT